MKKIVMTIVVASLVFTACSNGSTKPTTQDSTTVDSTKVAVDSTKTDSTLVK